MAADWVVRLHILSHESICRGGEWLLDTALKVLAMATLTIWFSRATWWNRSDRISRCVTGALAVSVVGDLVTQFHLGAYAGILIFLVAHLLYLGVVDFNAFSGGPSRLVWLVIVFEIMALTAFFGGTPLGGPIWAITFLAIVYLISSGGAIVAYPKYAQVLPAESGAQQLGWAAGGLVAQLIADGMLAVRFLALGAADQCMPNGRRMPALSEGSIVLYHLGQCLVAASLLTTVRRIGSRNGSDVPPALMSGGTVASATLDRLVRRARK
jgi:uncharacterized membrane protein YhhN